MSSIPECPKGVKRIRALGAAPERGWVGPDNKISAPNADTPSTAHPQTSVRMIVPAEIRMPAVPSVAANLMGAERRKVRAAIDRLRAARAHAGSGRAAKRAVLSEAARNTAARGALSEEPAALRSSRPDTRPS